MRLALGTTTHDVATRALVMGILNRTTDSFFDKGAYYDLDRFWTRADALVAAGADILDTGGVKAGPGDPVDEAEELERVVPAIEGLHARFDVALSVDTWRAGVARASYSAGAVVGNDISGFADDAYLPAAAEAGATVVATHIRLRPRLRDPQPTYPGGVVHDVRDFLAERARRAEAAGIPPERIVIDAGLDLGKTTPQSVLLLRESRRLAELGYPLLLSASNKTFLGQFLDLELRDRATASLSAAAMGIAGGCRILRVHDVAGTCRVRDVMAAVLEAA
ncbi:MAG: dihydropteroate synthase [Acidimicrobiales bacterium]